MNNLIRINLNQTVSKTELKEKRTDKFRWVVFYFTIFLFLGLITWQSILIISSNTLKTDENLLIKNIKDEIKKMKVSLKDFDEKRSLRPEARLENAVLAGYPSTELAPHIMKAQIDELVGPIEVRDGYSVFKILSRSNSTFEYFILLGINSCIVVKQFS